MTDRYLFDKRKRKRTFLKYLIIFGIGFVPVVLFNIAVSQKLDNWLVILIDSVFLLIIAMIGNLIANRIYEKKDAKLNAKIKEREELAKQKKLIMERSYQKIREKKKMENNKQIDKKPRRK